MVRAAARDQHPLTPSDAGPSARGWRAMLPARLALFAALAIAAGLCGCNPAGYPTCYRIECPYPPVYQNSYAGYIPATTTSPVGGPAVEAFDDPFADYTQRSLTISPSSGNAQASNLALQTATPWPRYSSDTSIPANGADGGGRQEAGGNEQGGRRFAGDQHRRRRLVVWRRRNGRRRTRRTISRKPGRPRGEARSDAVRRHSARVQHTFSNVQHAFGAEFDPLIHP